MIAFIRCSSPPLPTPLNHSNKKSEYNPSSSVSYSKCLSADSQKNSSSIDRIRAHYLERDSSLEKLKTNKDSDPVRVLEEDGDWSKEQFWDVVSFLRQSSRSREILEVFGMWKSRKKSRTNDENFQKIIMILVEEGLLEPAVTIIKEMNHSGFRFSLEMYNSVIHGLAKNGKFKDCMLYMKEMEEELGIKADTETFDGLIQAYGNHKMYDEMNHCVKEMESRGCQSDHTTYNLLIREFARAGLLNKMENTYLKLPNRRMYLQRSTFITMIEAYAKFGILDKMEKVYHQYLKSGRILKEDLIRKVAAVYVENHMFSRLENLGYDLSSKNGCSELVWCLRLLCQACHLSKKGMYSVVEEMESLGVPWSPTVTNILALAYMKMKDYNQLKVLLLELPSRHVKPDIITVGILFDACLDGFHGTSVKKTWEKVGFFNSDLEIHTDSLVLAAFGKGYFLKTCERMSMSPKTGSKVKQVQTYSHLINLIRTQADVHGYN
ncbi:pentatricopeptide repeat-containing protein At4g14190, chloroplastic [Primulina eburnea]|uniref:pentatricopeptide repeat-containing protein At4g14190, chloroplastic n=1 Tax=Primulina eburnea TaxID=1245227 RepID=UPI003C6C9D6A